VLVDRAGKLRWSQVLRQPALIVWLLYVLLIPFYVFRPGLPQPADMLTILLAPIVLRRWDGRLSAEGRATFRPLLLFTFWVCVVNYGWAVWLGDYGLVGVDTFALFPIYYIYNALMFLIALVLYRRYGEPFLRCTVTVLIGTIFFQVGASFVMRSSVARGSLFFLNPNQLGYYALLSATIVALLHRRLKLRLLTSSIALTSCGYLAVISASRAAAGGIALLLALLIFSNPKIIIVASLAAISLISVGGPVANAFKNSEDRLLNTSSKGGTFFEERGYDRLWEHEQYLLLGAGEGGFSRFEDPLRGKMEIHSSPGTILFSYGIFGAFIFMVVVWRTLRRARLRNTIMLFPPLAYMIAHQGLRFTLLWVLLAFFIVLKEVPPARAAGTAT